VISADGEYQASRKLSDAAHVMADTPAALQLRLLETVVEVAAEKNSTLVLPFPVELLQFVDRIHQPAAEKPHTPAEEPEEPETPDLTEAPELTEAERRAAELPEEPTPTPALPKQRATEEPTETEVLGTA
jgi:hypothetical protein